MSKRKEAGLWDYLKEAFTFRWNLLFFLGAAAAAAISPVPEVALPLVGAAELAYLTAMAATPRFRSAIDAKVYHEGRGERPVPQADPKQSLQSLVTGLSTKGRIRFEELRHRCVEMQSIASGVTGRAKRRGSATELEGSGLDRLLWVFLRLLYSQTSLAKFIGSTDGDEIERRVAEMHERLTSAEAEDGPDDRLVRSLRDSLATQELRLDNYRKAEKNAEFVEIELDRLEGKIQTLSEMAVNRQDPDFISREVDSVAASMNQTEKAISELSMVDGLLDDLNEPPPILRADLREVISDG